MSINVICCQYFSGSKMGGSDNDIIYVSALLAAARSDDSKHEARAA